MLAGGLALRPRRGPFGNARGKDALIFYRSYFPKSFFLEGRKRAFLIISSANGKTSRFLMFAPPHTAFWERARGNHLWLTKTGSPAVPLPISPLRSCEKRESVL